MERITLRALIGAAAASAAFLTYALRALAALA